jgi:hypothetical protein
MAETWRQGPVDLYIYRILYRTRELVCGDLVLSRLTLLLRLRGDPMVDGYANVKSAYVDLRKSFARSSLTIPCADTHGAPLP